MTAPPPQTIIIYGERDRLPDQKVRLLPGPLALAAKVVGVLALGAAYYYGPSYVACRQMKERGMFYYGTTIETCMRERMAERVDPLGALARKLIPAL